MKAQEVEKIAKKLQRSCNLLIDKIGTIRIGKKTQKAEGLINFFKEDIDRLLFIVTFHIRFNDDMTIEITKADVFPVNWIPDIYVNPSNNGNPQSSHYKNFKDSIKTNE